MKELFTYFFLILLFGLFSLFILQSEKSNLVLTVYTPTKIGIDFNKNKSIENNEIICIENTESFSLEPSDDFYNKYSKELSLSKIDMINLGYLAQEFAIKTLLNKKVSIKYTPKVTKECHFAQVKINGVNYENLLNKSGFGIFNNKIGDLDNYKKQLEISKKLNLVILNHHSGKYHTLDCPYGNAAHDKIIIPQKQLPEGSKPCKFCHKSKSIQSKRYKLKKDINIFEIPKIPQPPLYSTDGKIKVLFTDFTKQLTPHNNCTTSVCKELVNQINSANQTIDIAIYGYSEIPAITQALTKAAQRGVKIRYIYDLPYDTTNVHYKDNNIIINLASESTSDKTKSPTQSNMLMHNKFFIFDKKTVFTGSMNISPTGLSGYDVNDVIIISSKEIAELYTKEFEQMLNGKFHTSKNKLNLQNHFKLMNSEVEIYFSPKDKASTRIVELIKNAKSYVYIPTFLITHNNISNALIQAKQRGVDVRIIIDANSTNTRNSKHAILRHNGILLKTENYAGKLHSKMMIIDDEYLITGSMNFSNSGENKNDENLLIIKNSKIAKAHKDFFLYLWTMIPNKYLKINARAESKDSIGSCSDGIDNNFNGKFDFQEAACK